MIRLLVFICPFIYLSNICDISSLPKMAVIQICIYMLLGYIAIRKINSGEPLRSSASSVPIVLFIAWAVVSVVWSRNDYEWWYMIIHWLACAVGYWVVLQSRLDLYRVAQVFVLTGVTVSVVGIFQHWGWITFIYQKMPPAVTFINRNMAAQVVTMIIPLCICLCFRKRIIVGIVSAGVMVLFIYYAGSKSSMLATAVISAWVLLAWGRTLRLKVILVCLGLSLFVLGSIYVQNSSLVARQKIWWNTFEIVKAHPVAGIGLGNFQVMYPRYRAPDSDDGFGPDRKPRFAHNDYLQVMAELGVVGLSLLAWLAFIIIRTVHRSRDPMVHCYGLSLMALLVTAIFSFPFMMPVTVFYAFVIVGLISDLNGWCRVSKSTLVAILLTAVAASILSINLYSGWLIADKHYRNVGMAEDAGDQLKMIAESDEVIRLMPSIKKTYSYRGKANLDLGRFPAAVSDLENMLDAYPYHINSLLNVGVAYFKTDQIDKALAANRLALSILPGWHSAKFNLSVMEKYEKK